MCFFWGWCTYCLKRCSTTFLKCRRPWQSKDYAGRAAGRSVDAKPVGFRHGTTDHGSLVLLFEWFLLFLALLKGLLGNMFYCFWGFLSGKSKVGKARWWLSGCDFLWVLVAVFVFWEVIWMKMLSWLVDAHDCWRLLSVFHDCKGMTLEICLFSSCTLRPKGPIRLYRLLGFAPHIGIGRWNPNSKRLQRYAKIPLPKRRKDMKRQVFFHP